MKTRLALACVAVLLVASPGSRAAITVLDYYRLGETEPGAANSGVITNANDSTGLKNLTVMGGPLWSSNVSVEAASSLSARFSSAQPQYGTNSVLSTLTDNFGIEAWVNPTITILNHTIAYNGDSGLNGWGVIQSGNTYQGLFGGVVAFGSGAVTANGWTHVALVRASGTATLYVNGVASGTTTNAPNPPSGLFAIAITPQNLSADRFVGWLDEVRVFTFAPGQFSTNDLLNVNYTTPVNALLFDGTNGFAQAAPTGWTTNDSLTVEGWIYRAARGVNTDAAIASKSASGAGSSSAGEWMLGYGWGSDVVFRNYCISNGWAAYVLPSNDDLGQWHHLAGVYDNTNDRVQLYVDGVLRADLAAQRPLGTNGLPVWLGRTGSEYLNGQLDEVRLWRTARTAAEIQSNMYRSLVGNEPGLQAYWRFNEGVGLATTDATTNRFTAALSNSVSWVTSEVPFLPVVITLASTGTVNSATVLNGTVNPNNATTTVWFEWGFFTNDYAYVGQTLPANAGSGGAALPSAVLVTNFATGPLYHYHIAASNVAGVVYGVDALFGSPALLFNGPVTRECHVADPTTASTSPFGRITAGERHSLAFRVNGTVFGWGRSSLNTIPASATNVAAVGEGDFHVLFVRTNGTVGGWGSNSFHQIDIPASATNVVAVAGGSKHSVALRRNGTIAAWGDNFYGQTNVPPSATNVVAIAAAENYTLASRADGTVFGWGSNNPGRTKIPISATNVVSVAAGQSHGLALRADGTVVAWGPDLYGETEIPASATNVVAIAAGAYHTLALRADGTVAGCGLDINGQTDIPANASNVVAIAAGGYHSLALRADGTVVAWGLNDMGQINVPADANLGTPLTVTINGSLNTPGSSSLNYSVTNSIGGVATAARTVMVVDTTPPVITLLGVNPVAVPINTSFADSGATALDACGGPMPVSTNGNVNVNTLGTYTVAYISTDTYGNTATNTRLVAVFSPTPIPPGDLNGDGIVSQAELDAVYASYLPTSPWLAMTNVAGLGSTNVTFSLSNSIAGAFGVEYSTNLIDWFFLGPATPRYLFTDTNAPAEPQRYYRLRSEPSPSP